MLLEIKVVHIFLHGRSLLMSRRNTSGSMKINEIYGLVGARCPESNLMECNSDLV